MTISQIINCLEQIAPPSYQESYDNCGLLVGNAGWQCLGVLATLDVTEDVVQEAKAKGCNLIVAHHPIIFGGLKKINGKNYVEKTVIAAIKNDIAIYAIHTNLDNVIDGVNKKFADVLGLMNTSILQPKSHLLSKLIVFVPQANAEVLKEALFAAGAGNISNYSECSFSTTGTGTFKGNDLSNPVLGQRNIRETAQEIKLEVIIPNFLQHKIVAAMLAAHPYEEVAFDVVPLANTYQQIGSGMIGDLENEISEVELLQFLSKKFNIKAIKHTALLNKNVKKVALCGGSGSFLTKTAIAAGADVFITSDIKYHEFFDAENKIVLIDIGHYESEYNTVELFIHILKSNFPNFAVLKSEVNTNPVHYFINKIDEC